MRLNKFGGKTKKRFKKVESEQNENGDTNLQPSLKNDINMLQRIINLITEFFSMIGDGFSNGINGIKKFFQELNPFKEKMNKLIKDQVTNTGDVIHGGTDDIDDIEVIDLTNNGNNPVEQTVVEAIAKPNNPFTIMNLLGIIGEKLYFLFGWLLYIIKSITISPVVMGYNLINQAIIYYSINKQLKNLEKLVNPESFKNKDKFGNYAGEENIPQLNRMNDYFRNDGINRNLKNKTGGSANVLKVSQEEFAKLVDKILKGSDSGFKKLYEMSKLIKFDANGEKAKKIIEVLANNKNMAIITSSLFAISYATSYLLKKPAKTVEKQFAKNTDLTKGNMEKIENTINKQIKNAEEKEKTKSQIKTSANAKSRSKSKSNSN